jgi:hypothetical protein
MVLNRRLKQSYVCVKGHGANYILPHSLISSSCNAYIFRNPFILQPFGRSPKNLDFFYIIYHSPSVNARIPLKVLLTRCVDKEDNLMIPVVFSLVSHYSPFNKTDKKSYYSKNLFEWAQSILLALSFTSSWFGSNGHPLYMYIRFTTMAN